MGISNLVVCSWNANSVRNELNYFIEFMNRAEVGIISETKLSLKDKFTIRNYNCERQNAAGGVPILTKHDIPYKVVKIKGNTV